MLSLRSVIVEDDALALKRLHRLLGRLDAIEVVGHAIDGFSAVDVINCEKPDVLFLDIELPGQNGYQVLRHIHHRPAVIIVTADIHHERRPLWGGSYLVITKPVEMALLQSAIDTLRAQLPAAAAVT